jgi:two-component system, OmpR family, sensor histidine kinase KdpD
VRTPKEDLEHMSAGAERQIANTKELALKLGAVPLEYKGTDVARTIAAFAKEYSITHIVLGRSQQPWYRRWFGQAVLDQLLRVLPGVDVVLVDGN